MFVRLTLLGVCCFAASISNCQEAASAGPKWTPQSDPESVITYEYVCVAKVSPDGKTLQLRIPKYKLETRTKTVPVTSYVTETRTREVTVDGQAVTQAYSVNIPVTETHEQTYTVRRPIDVKQQDVPISDVRAWDLTGQSIEAATLASRLKEPVHVYARSADPGERFEPIDPYFASVMRPDTLVLFYMPSKPESK